MTAKQRRAPADPKLAQIIEELREIAARRPSIARTDHKGVKSTETIRRILDAAYAVFVREGYAGSSLRKVADEADIAVGNLTYHFATKTQLLQAMLAEKLARYIDDHLETLNGADADATDLLLEVVAYYAGNARNAHNFFYQMWGYAGSSDEARGFVRDLYRPIGWLIMALIRLANPALDRRDVQRAVLQIVSLFEGYRLFSGLDLEEDLALSAAEDDIRALTRKIVFG